MLNEAGRDKTMSVYFIRDSHGNTKIGHSCDIEGRLKSLQTGNPYELKVVRQIKGASLQAEKEIHSYFGHRKIRGEWFNISMAEIDSICNKYIYIYPFVPKTPVKNVQFRSSFFGTDMPANDLYRLYKIKSIANNVGSVFFRGIFSGISCVMKNIGVIFFYISFAMIGISIPACITTDMIFPFFAPMWVAISYVSYILLVKYKR